MARGNRFDGRVAIVTGGTMGIGEGIVRRLIDEGARVACGARGEEPLQKLAAELGDKFLGVRTDVSKENEIKNLVAVAVEHFGRLDLMVNNAGFGQPNPIVNVTEAEFDSIVDINLKGVFFGTKHAARRMIGQGGGVIINIASINSRIPLYGGSSYSATKAAVEMFGKNAALELARHGIRVNTILPGLTETPLVAGMMANETIKGLYLDRIAVKRIASVDEIAAPVLFLASDEASYITGAALEVDGGMLLTGYPDLSLLFGSPSEGNTQ